MLFEAFSLRTITMYSKNHSIKLWDLCLKIQILNLVTFITLVEASYFLPTSYENNNSNERPFSLQLSGVSCGFPSRWEGNWFQSGIHLGITINSSTITTKGTCIEADGDKFIVYSPEEKCYRCLVFNEKHYNVLQYKETFCESDANGLSLQSLCRRIPGDGNLYSIFRLDAEPMSCPFQGSFTFSYSRGKGVCGSPVSTIDSCTEPSRLKFSYQACYDVPGAESSAEIVECLGVWKEGSTRYMVGLMDYHDPSSYEDRFRCYAFERIGAKRDLISPSPLLRDQNKTILNSLIPQLSESDKLSFRVSESEDATCLGLSPVEGSKTLTISRAFPILEFCEFPSWLRLHPNWVTLKGDMIYSFEESTLRVKKSSIDDGEMKTLVTHAFCAKRVFEEDDRQSFVIRSTTGCQIGYKCLRIRKREAYIIEVQFGKLSRDIESACSMLDVSPFILLTSPNPEIRQCPYFGQFEITSQLARQLPYFQNYENCQSSGRSGIEMGCRSLESVILNFPCGKSEFSCNGWWEENEGLFVLLTSGDKTQRACLKVSEHVKNLEAQEVRGRKIALESSENLDERVKKSYNFELSYENCYLLKSSSPLSQILNQLNFNTSDIDQCSEISAGNIAHIQSVFILVLCYSSLLLSKSFHLLHI